MRGNDPVLGDDRAQERIRMVETQIASRGVRDPRVLSVMKQIPRHIFIPPPYQGAAYDDRPLPIGNGQTISQPYIVAVMTELLEVNPEDRILEIGAGSGYQAAILAGLAREVVSIERLPEVAEYARRNLALAKVTNVEIRVGDGTEGYPERAPYNGILITAATPAVPPPLIDQLAEGGRLVAPVGSRDLQELERLEKTGNSLVRTTHGGVVFVPLLGHYGWRD